MFDFLKKKVVAPDDVLAAPIKGMAVPSSSINDPTFGQVMNLRNFANKSK